MPRLVKPKVGTAAGAKPAAVAKKKSNKLYAMPEKVKEGTILTDLSKGQWRIGPSIGTGGFGEIYSACRVGEKAYEYVVKCEPHGNGPLFVEMHFYMRNARLDDIKKYTKERNLKNLGMPHMIGSGSSDINGLKHRFIVMPRYGSDVAKHFLANGRRLPEGTTYRLAMQMIDVYEFVHNSGYVHADLKAANILLGYGKNGGAQAYLVDYGLASHYTTKEFKPDPKKMHNGTIEYTSRDAHHGVATRRADFEILGYNLIEWLGGQLPWVEEKLLATPVKVQKSKETFMTNVSANLKKIFVKGAPGPIVEFMTYVAKLEYNDVPDYNKCRQIFTKALSVLRIPNSGDLDFKMKSSGSNNNISPVPVKTAKITKQRAVVVESDASEDDAVIDNDDDDSDEVVCASDEDDGDVVFDKKTHSIRTPASTKKKALKTIVKSPHKTKPSPPSTSRAKRSNVELKNTYNSPRKSPGAARPQQVGSVHKSSPRLRATPVSAKASINLSPAISMLRSSSSRPGKTIINDNLTPNPRAGKTYEFNFELDVSMDANVVVNVKRKKKAKNVTSSLAGTPQANGGGSAGDTPVTRVKVRKLQSDGDSSSPQSPAVIVKKSKRIVTPR